MNELWNENIKIRIQQMLPALFTILFILIFNVPLYPFVSDSIRPYVSIICVYFWLIHRPYLFGITSVYLIGALEDIVSSVPFGTNIFIVLFVYILTNIASKFVTNKSFVVAWYGFSFIAFAAFIMKWLIISIYYSHFIPLSSTIFALLTTIAFYPIFSIINVYIHECFMQGED